MSKKLYVCKECGNVFSEQLYHLIETNVQVYCEKCGTLFFFEGVKFKFEPEKEVKISQKPSEPISSDLQRTILKLNNISYIPVLIISLIFLGLTIIFPGFILIGIYGIIISLYDKKFISPKIKEKRYNEIVLDSFFIGILGCILFGTGVIILIKGILILINAYYSFQKEKLKPYDLGLQLKNSLNNFSALACFLIMLLVFYSIAIGTRIVSGPFIVFFLMAIFALIIDLALRKNIKKKLKFNILDFLTIIFIGVIGTIFSLAGIFILLKGLVILFLLFGEPIELEREIPEEEKVDLKETKRPALYESPPIKVPQEKPIEIKKEEVKIEKKEIPTLKKKEEIELKLHESLLPIKDKKDKELVIEYFSKIFAVLSKDLRKQIIDLKIPKKDKNELLKELAFLTEEEQVKYIDVVINLYREIPLKLIERIKSLKNVKPEHYSKLAEQLKYMNFDEQVRFVQFLEDNA